MKFSQLESTPESHFDFEEEQSGPRRMYRPVAPTLLDEELSRFEAYTDGGSPGVDWGPQAAGRSSTPPSRRTVRSRRAQPLFVPPPPAPVRPRAAPTYHPLLAPAPTPAQSWPPPAWSIDEEVVLAPHRPPASRRLLALLALTAAGLMGASLWLSPASSFSARPLAERRVETSAASAAEDGRSCELTSADLVTRAVPAPTLGPVPARRAVGPAPAPKHTEAVAMTPAVETVAPAPTLRPGGGLEQASRTAQMLREQLGQSVR